MLINIETERCVVRKFIKKDIEEFIVYRNDETWMQYQGFKGLSREEYTSKLLKESSLEDGMQLAIISKADESLIGDIYLNKSDDVFWIGYTISPLYSRQGYAYEVTKEVINWIKIQGVKRVYAGVIPENLGSIKLLEKLGFSYSKLDSSGEKIYSLEI